MKTDTRPNGGLPKASWKRSRIRQYNQRQAGTICLASAYSLAQARSMSERWGFGPASRPQNNTWSLCATMLRFYTLCISMSNMGTPGALTVTNVASDGRASLGPYQLQLAFKLSRVFTVTGNW